jgi:hypothetical protein
MMDSEQLDKNARLFLDQEAYQFVDNPDALSHAAFFMGDDLPSLLVAYFIWQNGAYEHGAASRKQQITAPRLY